MKREITGFLAELAGEVRSPAMREKYARDVVQFLRDLRGQELTRENVATWRDGLLDKLSAASVNSIVSGVGSSLLARSRQSKYAL